jgi:hypothetical protein
MVFGRKQRWYWCQEHERAEQKKGACARDKRLGPYESKVAAESWQERFEQRAAEAKAADEEWSKAGLQDEDS